MLRRAAIIVFAFIAAHVAIAQASAPSDADVSAIQQIISDQISAFRADDGAKAYGFASPGIKQIFPSPEIFMSMVRQGYPQVYRPQSFTFGRSELGENGTPIQHVILIGPDGKDYEAVYAMEQQPDGSWKISGCVIAVLRGSEA